ncbi:hypothetical protein C0J26_07240 [Pseudomonas baetica]|nr:hypothetical protein C0J26_07240 [Pseudomonas baetica]
MAPGFFVSACFEPCTNPLWERACSRKRWISQSGSRLTLSLREQAPSHSERWVRPLVSRNRAR